MNIPKLIASIALCWTVAIIGSIITLPAIDTWYPTLTKPFFNPPNWIFGPVWTILFLLMGISFYLIWTRSPEKNAAKKAMTFFLMQLVLNFLWSLFFFGLHSPLLAFIDIILLLIAILITIKHFIIVSRLSAYLLFPYILWVSFAAVLNLFIVILN